MKLEELLQPVAGDDPAGAPCDHDRRFQVVAELAELLVLRAEIVELKRMAQGPFEGENALGDKQMADSTLQRAEARARVVAANQNLKESDGHKLQVNLEAECIDLLAKGKDLRVVVPLTLVRLRSRGLPGLLEGLALFEGLLKTFGDAVHPRLDEEDLRDRDDSIRSRVFADLSSSAGATAVLREAVLLNTKVGRVAMRDAEVLDRVLAPDPAGVSVTNDEHFLLVVKHDAALQSGSDPDSVTPDQMRERLRQLHAELNAAHETLRRIGASFERTPPGQAHFQALIGRMASRVGKYFDDLMAREAMAHVDQMMNAPGEAPTTRPPMSQPVHAVMSTATPASMAPASAAPQNREQIRLQVLQLATMLEQLEPSHPAPLFLRRAARLLAAKSFYDIVSDMVPESMSQVETLAGDTKRDA